jgi:transposase
MARPLLSDALWQEVEPLLPKRPPRPRGGRPPISDRAALMGILFVLRTGIPWELLPQEMGCGSGMTCWRRLRDWYAAGVWDKLHALFLRRLREQARIDWSRVSLDSASVPSPRGVRRPGRTRRTGANSGRSGMWPSMHRAPPW